MKSLNGQHENQQPTESLNNEFGRLEIKKNLPLETRLIEVRMRRHRFRLVLHIVKWSVIAAAVVLATVAANHVGVI